MRVIAGRWRGRRLKTPSGTGVRPTTDRTKEALFNILGTQLADCVVLDLCCGAGGLGLEALSRGAAKVIFVDTARSSLKLTQANLVVCGARTGSFQLELGDAVGWFSRWSGTGGAPWTLLCDPHYRSETARDIIAMSAGAGIPPGLVAAVVEYGAQTPGMSGLGPPWQTRRYGESHLAIFKPGAAMPAQE